MRTAALVAAMTHCPYCGPTTLAATTYPNTAALACTQCGPGCPGQSA